MARRIAIILIWSVVASGLWYLIFYVTVNIGVRSLRRFGWTTVPFVRVELIEDAFWGGFLIINPFVAVLGMRGRLLGLRHHSLERGFPLDQECGAGSAQTLR